jgi:hypothetical protein
VTKTQLVLPVDGPFSLSAAASFGFGPNTGQPSGDDSVMRLAFVADDLRHHVGAALTQLPDDSLTAEVECEGPADAAEAQLRRILSIDAGADGWLAAGRADQMLGRLQAAYPGLRPVLFHSPYEAAAWSVLSQRRHRTQGMALRRRLSEAAGATFDLAGQLGQTRWPRRRSTSGRLRQVVVVPQVVGEARLTERESVRYPSRAQVHESRIAGADAVDPLQARKRRLMRHRPQGCRVQLPFERRPGDAVQSRHPAVLDAGKPRDLEQVLRQPAAAPRRCAPPAAHPSRRSNPPSP